MNKIIVIVLIISILIIQNSFCQESNVSKVIVGNKEIQFQQPRIDFSEIGESKRKLLEDQVPPSNRILACYMPKDVAVKFGIEPVTIKKRIMIQTLKANENIEFTGSDFIDLKQVIGNSFSAQLDKATFEANRHYENLQYRYGNLKMEKPIILEVFEDNKDSYAFIALMNINTDQGLINVLTGTLIKKIKGRILYIYVSNVLENDDSVPWILSTCNSLSKSFTDLNN